MSQPKKILVVPVGLVDEEILCRLQWVLMRSFKRPTLINDKFASDLRDAAPEKVMARVRAAFHELMPVTPERLDAIIVVVDRELSAGAIGMAANPGRRPRFILCCIAGYAATDCTIASIVHSTGHAFGLGCCHCPGCIMNHWDPCGHERMLSNESFFCSDCGQAVLHRSYS